MLSTSGTCSGSQVVKGEIRGVPGGQGGRLGSPMVSRGGQGVSQGVKGDVTGVLKYQRRHLNGLLIICKAVQVILRIQWGHWVCLGVQGFEGGAQEVQGVKGTSRGSPWTIGLV